MKLLFPPIAQGWEHLDIRVRPPGHPALRNKFVRRALAYGIDRVALVRSVFEDMKIERTLRPLDSVVLRSSNDAYRPNWSIYRYRPDAARRLLVRAGCRRGADGIYSCAGQRLSLRFVVLGNLPRRVQTFELVQAQFKQAGVEVVPSYVLRSGFSRSLRPGAFDVTLFSWFGNLAEDGAAKASTAVGVPRTTSGLLPAARHTRPRPERPRSSTRASGHGS